MIFLHTYIRVYIQFQTAEKILNHEHAWIQQKLHGFAFMGIIDINIMQHILNK